MRFFKTNNLPEESVANNNPVAEEPLQEPETDDNGLSMEEIARRWWSRHLGGSIPQDIENWLQQLTRTEARRLTLEGSLLSEKQLERTSEAFRLSKTHMQHIGEQMQRVRKQQEWLHNFQRMNHARQQHADQLYEVNKRLSVGIDAEKRLERFETFEPVQGSFQHLRLLTAMSQQQRSAMSKIQEQSQQLALEVENQKKQLVQHRNRLTESEKQMEQANDQVDQMCRILGERVVLDVALRDAASRSELLAQQQVRLTRYRDEQKELSGQLETRLSELRTRRQGLEAHRAMLHRGREIMLRLTLMTEARADINATSVKIASVGRELREENKKLAALFQDYQRLEGELGELSDELQQHRLSIAGATSYQLQERAMREKTRHQILLSAQAIWKHICAGYQQKDVLEQELTQLTLQLQHGRESQAQLEKEVARLEESTRDKERTLTLSKSQSVIELRSDLREGISCTVCGALHHPYHSDTMLEQNKLIDDIRIEYNQLNQEFIAKARILDQLYLDNTRLEEALKQKRQFLSYVEYYQSQLVAQWQMYAGLDSSFADCTPGTNQDARTEMLRLLVENTLRQSDDAQRELDTHNFHQSQINKLTEQIAQKEQEKNSLTIRLNEVNTGCQVLGRQVELLEEVRADAQKRYSAHYEEVEKSITLHEWMKQWENDCEGLCQRINDMMTQWKSVQNEIAQLEAQKAQSLSLTKYLEESQKFIESALQATQLETEKLTLMLDEGQKRYDQLMELYREESFHKTRYQELRQGYARMEELQQEFGKVMQARANMEGRQQELSRNSQDTDRQVAQLRNNLDLWISRYNATHPPVQYEELETTLDGTTDWAAVRQQIRRTRVDADTQQQLVDHLETEIMEMQAIASKNSTNIHDLTEQSLADELERLTEEFYREAVAMSRYQLALERDREMRQSLAQESDSLQGLSDK